MLSFSFEGLPVRVLIFREQIVRHGDFYPGILVCLSVICYGLCCYRVMKIFDCIAIMNLLFIFRACLYGL